MIKKKKYKPKITVIDSNPSRFKIKEFYEYKSLIWLFVKRDFTYLYKQTVLGPFWFFVQPLMTSVLFVFIFNKAIKISTQEIPPILFYLSGITLWNYFSESINKISETFVTNKPIFEKVYFPRLIMPLSIIISVLLKLGVQLTLFIIVYIFVSINYDYLPGLNIYILLFPVLVFLMALLSVGVGLIVSALTIKYRDLRFVIQFGVQLWFFITPVVYPLSSLSETQREYLLLNPVSIIIETFRLGCFGSGYFSIDKFIISALISFFILILGIVLYNKIEGKLVDIA